jgi:imidazolonepropionase-like amidohydrolase
VALSLLLTLPLCFAQAPEADSTVFIRAARVLDPVAGVVLEDAAVLIHNDEIISFGTDLRIPEGAQLIDLGDSTLMPGWIDCHVHLGYQIDAETFGRETQDTAVHDAIRATGHAKITLEAGFTTVRNVGSRGFVDVALARAIDRGEVVGPRVIPAGYALSITGGHGDVTGHAPGILEMGPEQGVADGADAFTRATRYQIKHGAEVIKIIATAGVLSFEKGVGAQQMSRDELQAVVEEAARHGVKVCAHAHGKAGIMAAVKAGVDSIEHGSLIDEKIAAEMIKRGTYLVPTTVIPELLDLSVLPEHIANKARDVLPKAVEGVKTAIRVGVPIAFGTDAAVIPHGQNAKEFAALVKRGFTPMQALQSATINAAKLLGRDDLGRLTAGCQADLVGVPGNPLSDITRTESVNFVMKGGRVFKRELPSHQLSR